MRRDPFYQDCYDFFAIFLRQKHQIVVSPMTFRDIEYILRKVERDPEQRSKVLRDIYSSIYKIIDLAPDDVINVMYENYPDFEDGLLIESAERKMLDGIVTNNARDFKSSKVPVYSPKELKELLEKL